MFSRESAILELMHFPFTYFSTIYFPRRVTSRHWRLRKVSSTFTFLKFLPVFSKLYRYVFKANTSLKLLKNKHFVRVMRIYRCIFFKCLRYFCRASGWSTLRTSVRLQWCPISRRNHSTSKDQRLMLWKRCPFCNIYRSTQTKKIRFEDMSLSSCDFPTGCLSRN